MKFPRLSRFTFHVSRPLVFLVAATLLINATAFAQVALNPDGVVDIPDPNLEGAIRDQLNWEHPTILPEAPITQHHMLQLKWLDGRGKNITDLTGLEYATNLVYLYLCCNDIESVEPLAGLTKLWLLDLGLNRIQDVTPLANLVNLEKLTLVHNLTTDFTPLQGLNLIEFYYDEVCDFPPIAPPVRERMARRSFPSIFAWNAAGSTLELDHLTTNQRAALHDLDFGGDFGRWNLTATEPFEGITTSLAFNLDDSERHQRRNDLNPNLLSLLYINTHSHFTDEAYPPGSDYFLRDENGELIRRGTGSPNINFLRPEVQDLLVKRFVAAADCGYYDGIMLDQFADHGAWGHRIYGVPKEEIIQAFTNIFKAVREQVRDDFLILINAGREKITRYTEYVNGSFMEIGSDNQYLSGMPGGYSYNGLRRIENTLSWLEENLRSPQINCLEGWGIPAEPPDSPENRRWMRVITTLSLTHSDGYVMYNTGWGAVETCPECPYPWGPGHEHIWYDFWDADLGQPIAPKAQHHQNIEGLFIREFTNGWAVYNRSGNAQTVSLPQYTTGFSSSKSGITHRLPDLDGEIYLKARNPADVNGDGKINILDLVQVANGFGKSDPDLNGDGVVNILDLTLVAKHLSQNAAAPSQLALIESIPSTAKEVIAVQRALTELEAIPNKSHGVQIAIELLRHYLSIADPNVQETKLLSNYPNPFNPETWIPYQLSEGSTVTVKIYDVTGSLVRTIQVGHKPAGYYHTRERAIYWDGRNQNREPVSSGVYFYTFNTDTYTQTRRMVILK